MKFSRRLFLKNTGKLFLGGSLLSNISWEAYPNTSQKSKDVLVSAHPWVYAANLEENDISPILEMIFQDMKYAGMDGIELMEQPLRSYQTTLEMQDYINKYRLPVIGASYGADMWEKSGNTQIVEDVDNITTNLEKLGGRTLGISVGKAPEKKTGQQLDNQANLVRILMAICQQKNILLHLHNHGYTVENDMYDLKGMVKRIPELQLGPDVGCMLDSGINPVKFIQQYKEKIVFIHIRDQFDDGSSCEAVGDGHVDFKQIGKALRKAKFKGNLVIELRYDEGFQPSRTIRENLKISREFIKNRMGV